MTDSSKKVTAALTLSLRKATKNITEAAILEIWDDSTGGFVHTATNNTVFSTTEVVPSDYDVSVQRNYAILRMVQQSVQFSPCVCSD